MQILLTIMLFSFVAVGIAFLVSGEVSDENLTYKISVVTCFLGVVIMVIDLIAMILVLIWT